MSQNKAQAASEVARIKAMSLEMSEATDRIIGMLPSHIDLEQFIGLVGNLCLAYGVKGRDMAVFRRELHQFIRTMEPVQRKAMAQLRN